MIKIITDKKEKDTLTKMYFHGITARALEEFSKKEFIHNIYNKINNNTLYTFNCTSSYT